MAVIQDRILEQYESDKIDYEDNGFALEFDDDDGDGEEVNDSESAYTKKHHLPKPK
eukprot:Pgem_evm1s18293